MRWLFPLTVLLMVSACTPPTQTTTDNAMVSEMSADEGDAMATDNMTATDGAMMSNDAMMSNNAMMSSVEMDMNAVDANAMDTPTGDRSPPIADNVGDDVVERTYFCELVKEFINSTECRFIEVQKQHLSAGIAAFKPPSTMVVGQSTDLMIALGDRQQVSKFDDVLGDNTSARVEVKVQMGRYMRATLSGSSFSIESLDDAQKDLGASEFATWHWRVTPKEAGEHPLILKVETNAIASNGKPTMLELAAKRVVINVDVDPKQRRKNFFKEVQEFFDYLTETLGSGKNLLIAVSGLIVAAGVVYAAIRNFRKNGESFDNSGNKSDKPPTV
ncbi:MULTISPECIES: hypothetical protein [unclassified Sphingomonas]|uniref:hypothetical protein n=1 Tax=unclassified Sphingomonas TaxID=196159 RepID=UPI00268FF069